MLLVACQKSSSSLFVECELQNPDGSRTPTIRAELARSSGERTLGLMYRKQMPKQDGMLFVFPDEKPRSFWMKNTYIPLDIIYLSSEKKVVSISKNTPAMSTKGRPSTLPAQYVLELNAGLSKEWGIVKGSTLSVSDESLLVAQ